MRRTRGLCVVLLPPSLFSLTQYEEALCHFEGEEAAQIYVEEMTREENIQESPHLRTFDSRMAALGIKSEEDFQEHLTVPLSSTTEYIQSQFLEPSQEAMEKAFPMQATRIPPDIAFLHRHVPETCGGKVPPLLGPYSVPLLLKGLKHYNAKHFKGLEF
ncbi:hypothetical protein CAPTEDRAFT_223098 [Capitella teleta]|uniref:Uncharacterized protein n=1 Tax=Capitella teleta TaxID=283909 RepID=R7UZQ0_CAPTE|nr:hypothetical protein CAPTEDRAFT_223098 [Capitella teleta]|eukprot:ELU11717.1 hypothetical protein CAPTEDRAFT_223098 [Capitella teleta]